MAMPASDTRAVSVTRTVSPIARALASPKVNGILFTLPAIILVVLVIVLPLLQSFYFSFTNWKGARADWIGIGNYTQMFADPELRKSLTNSMLIFVSIPIGMIGLELSDPSQDQHLLSRALERGPVREFSRVIPALADIYREVAR